MSQHVLETEYYMIDLPRILESKRRQRAIQNHAQALNTMLPYWDDKTRQRFLTELERQAGIEQVSQSRFNHEQFAKFKALFGKGGSKKSQTEAQTPETSEHV